MSKYYYIKCIIDFILALVGLIVLLPLLLIIGILVKVDSKGPIFFLQERLGQNGKVFKIYKFRTMVDRAINIGSGLHTYEGDPRITKVGNILRKTSLDELPQLINVLKGEMSLIGPRPPVPYLPMRYENYSSTKKRRFLLKPGITGYAQVKVRNSVNWEKRIKFDIHYIDNFSFILDYYIFLKTVLIVFKCENVYGSNKNIL